MVKMATYNKKSTRNKSDAQKEKEASSRQYSVMAIPYSSLKKGAQFRFDRLVETEELIGFQTISEETMKKVESLFEADLYEKQRKCMHLYFSRGKTLSEIAGSMDMQPKHVSRSIRNGVKRIEKNVDDFDSIAWYFKRYKSVKSNRSKPRTNWDRMTTPSIRYGIIQGKSNNNLEWKFIRLAKAIKEYTDAKYHLRCRSSIGGGLLSEYVKNKQLPIPRNF